MEISVMYPAAGERPCWHTMGGLSEYASFGIVKGGGTERERKNHLTLGLL